MTTTILAFQSSRSARPMLRWIFRRGDRLLTCELDTHNRHTFDVCLVPHWNLSGTVIERFGDAVGAMERHAQLARALRHAGWTVVQHASPERVPAAA